MLSRAIQPRRRGRRPLTVLATMTIIAGLLVTSGTVLAVHDETFQLEGDALAATTTNAGGSTQSFDWDSIFTAAGAPVAALPAGFGDAAFKADFKKNTNGSFSTADDTTYATGSKDTLPISGWQCNQDNNVNSKIDVMNAYTVSYEAPNGDEIQYFALERNANTGTADVGFWFFQDTVGCVSTGSAVTFTGEHKDGDVLVVSEFTNGGVVSTINVYRWDRTNGHADCNADPIGPLCILNPPGVPGSLNPAPIGQGVDCRDPIVLPDDAACAASNKTTNGNNGTIQVPWDTSNKQDGVGKALRTSEFFEGGINLTDLDLGGKCFNSFLGDTRSSTSLTATLFDYAGGTVGQCTSTTVTTPSITTGTIPADPADSRITVHDSALITVDGVDTFAGTVSFFLCGPTAADSTALCTSGGVPIGVKNITTSGSVDSDNATVSAAGRYCYRADFSGDASAGVPASSDSRSSECFVISPRTPTLSTQAGAGPVDFGQPVTDTATISGTARRPATGGSVVASINGTTIGALAGGTITFTLVKADCTTAATGTGTNPQSVTINGDGTTGSVSFTPDAPGIYHWKASYSGDSPNTLAQTHNGSCNDTNERVVVRQIPTTVKTKQSWFPQDTATITSTVGNLVAGGNVKFELFTNSTCAGANVFEQTIAVPGGNPSAELGTTNSTYRISTGYTDAANSTVGLHSWRVTYTPAAGDTAHTGSSSACNAERFNITYTNDPGPTPTP